MTDPKSWLSTGYTPSFPSSSVESPKERCLGISFFSSFFIVDLYQRSWEVYFPLLHWELCWRIQAPQSYILYGRYQCVIGLGILAGTGTGLLWFGRNRTFYTAESPNLPSPLKPQLIFKSQKSLLGYTYIMWTIYHIVFPYCCYFAPVPRATVIGGRGAAHEGLTPDKQ